jgi:predicted alpha/beta superfamily hydrolase
MKYKKIVYSIAIMVHCLLTTQGFSQTAESQLNYPEVALERTEVRTLYSNIVEQDYELLISLPHSYHLTDTNYPVIILLDPFRVFSIVKGFTDILTFPHSYIHEAIIVGIGYGGKGPQAKLNWVLGRTRDLTPAVDPTAEEYFQSRLMDMGITNVDIKTGGAELFLESIEKELFPYIESNYRIDPQKRILCGYSYGGLFALFTIFNNPGLFSGYLVGSPSIHYKNGMTFNYESNYAKSHKDLNADVFISAGALEKSTSENVAEVVAILRSRKYEGLRLQKVIFEDEDHVTCMPAAIGRGIVELLR